METKTIVNIGYGVNAGRYRSELYDVEYGMCTPTTGNKPIRSPHSLAYKKDGTLLFKEAAYVEAMKSIHGPEGNKTIIELLPILEELPPDKILGIPAWMPYPENIPSILVGDYYEGHDDGRYGQVRLYNIYHEELDDLNTWDDLGITEWRIRGSQPVMIDNPLYQPAVDRNTQRKIDYMNVLKLYFVVTGMYQYPGYTLGEWEWKENGVKIGGMRTEPKIPLDVNHRLANSTTGYKLIAQPLILGTTLYINQWNGKVNNTILCVPPKFPADARLKLVLGMPL